MGRPRTVALPPDTDRPSATYGRTQTATLVADLIKQGRIVVREMTEAERENNRIKAELRDTQIELVTTRRRLVEAEKELAVWRAGTVRGMRETGTQKGTETEPQADTSAVTEPETDRLRSMAVETWVGRTRR